MPENTPPSELLGSSERDRTECPACKSTEIDESIPSVGPVCEVCGAVISVAIDTDSKLNDFERDSASPSTWSDYNSVTNSTEQQIAIAFEVLEGISHCLCLPREIREQAANIYSEAAVETVTDGRSTEGVVAACITIAGRECQAPIPAGRIAEVVDVETDSLRRLYRFLQHELGYETPPCPPKDYLKEVARGLELDESTITAARQTLAAIPSQRLGGKHPGALAGAALYLAADGEITQRDVANIIAVTTETVRVRVKDCREAAGNADEKNRVDDSGKRQ